MLVIKKNGYTVRMLKDGTVTTKYTHTANDFIINTVGIVGGLILIGFMLYNVAQAMTMLAK